MKIIIKYKINIDPNIYCEVALDGYEAIKKVM
jgi:hypothetical protein